MCGDVIYTQGLVDNPPEGVEYTTYPDALANGTLHEFGRRDDLSQSYGIGRVGSLARIGRERSVNALRRRGLLFREPFRFFGVDPDAFDLVHCHVFSAAFPRLAQPLVMGNASTIEDLYRGARGWSDPHVRLASLADSSLAKAVHVQHTSHGMRSASAVVCFTHYLKRELLQRGSVEASRIHVAPCFVERGARRNATLEPNRIGFVASDFDAKGGQVVLDAFRVVRARRPNTELIIIGSSPRGNPAKLIAEGITWLPYVPRSVLLSEYFPTFDVFAYPTQFDGLPLVVLEAMSFGIPVATSDHAALPEVVGDGLAGSVTRAGDTGALADALLMLLDPTKNGEVRAQCAAWFDSNFSPDVAVQKLAHVYDVAISNPRYRAASR